MVTLIPIIGIKMPTVAGRFGVPQRQLSTLPVRVHPVPPTIQRFMGPGLMEKKLLISLFWVALQIIMELKLAPCTDTSIINYAASNPFRNAKQGYD